VLKIKRLEWYAKDQLIHETRHPKWGVFVNGKPDGIATLAGGRMAALEFTLSSSEGASRNDNQMRP